MAQDLLSPTDQGLPPKVALDGFDRGAFDGDLGEVDLAGSSFREEGELLQLLGIEPHNGGGDGVDADRVAASDDQVHRHRCAVHRAITLKTDDAVDDGEVGRADTNDVGDHALYARVVQGLSGRGVTGAAVGPSRGDPDEILTA